MGEVDKIIDNSTGSHFKEIKKLLRSCSEILIASPFISEDGVDEIVSCLSNRVETVTIVTTFKPENYDQVKKVPVLQKLYSALTYKSITVYIKIDNKLHGKVYIGKKGDHYSGAIITSANMTDSGLFRNHEWGSLIDSPSVVSRIYDQIINDTECIITNESLSVMAKMIDDKGLSEHNNKPNNITNLLDIVVPKHFLNVHGVTFWLKPYGTIDNQILPTMKFNEDCFKMTFARSVNRIREGDVFIVYAVGSRAILSVFEATSDKGSIESFPDKRAERWPFYVMCVNKTPQFGNHWSKSAISISSLIEKYVQLHPLSEIRPGSQNISVMRRGLDRLRLNKEFAEFVVDEVLASRQD